jgi:hypothetical protein
MIVWLWAAGSAEGVTDDEEKARRTAASSMCETGTGSAVVEQAYFIIGIDTLVTGYQKAGAPFWIARRHPGGRVSWTLHRAAPGLAAA